jgi:hypothetical protein
VGHMSRAAVSSLVWGIYMILLSITVFAIPDVILKLVGLEPHKDVWIYVVALLAFNLAIYSWSRLRGPCLQAWG